MKNDRIRIEPLTKVIGAEISGVDLRKPVDDETFTIIHNAFLEHLVIFFRDQAISHDQHVALGERFGELHIHPAAPCVDDRPELMKIHADATSPFAEGTRWHSDVSSDEEPPMASLLHLSVVPQVGGDTLFSNMYAAYDALSDTMKAVLDPLVALHTSDVHVGRYEQVGGGLRREAFPHAGAPGDPHPPRDRQEAHLRKRALHQTDRRDDASGERCDIAVSLSALCQPAVPMPVSLDTELARGLGQPLHPASRDLGLFPRDAKRRAGDRQG